MLSKLGAIAVAGITIVRVLAAWVRWDNGELPPVESLIFMSFGTLLGAGIVSYKLWVR